MPPSRRERPPRHGVTQFTANLVYSCESGALNESMSDVFGAMVDRDDWLMGEDLPGGYIRSLSDPRASRPPQPDTNNGANPCAEVHHNSGIPNKVAYLVSDGGVHYGVSVTGMGRGVAERIWYRALRFHMGSGTSFAGARNATINAATELYGAGSTAVCSVSSAWASVAIGSPCGPPPQDDDAVFVSQSVPTELNLNQQFQPTLTFRNVGTTTWRASDGYALGSQNGPNNTTWGHNRMPLPHDVGPQQEVTFTRVLTAPGNPATYPFKWRMVKDGVGLWFGAQSQQVNIRVGGGGLCPPAEAPQPLGPSGFIDDPTPTFSWTAVPGATKYKLYVQYGDAVGDIIINEDVFDTEYTPTNPLPVADDLRWKVKGDCPTASGPYSSIVPFHVLFADVPVGHWARSWVEALYRRPLFVSESLGTDALGRFLFGPENGIQRKHMARWLLKARHGAGYVPPPAQGIFSDVPVSSEFAPWAEAFYNQGFTAGCGASLFCPDTVVTREQAALLVLRAKEGTAYVPPACVTPTFSDVPCSSPFARWVEELHRRGITGGCAPGLFCPTAPAARAQFSVFTHKTFY